MVLSGLPIGLGRDMAKGGEPEVKGTAEEELEEGRVLLVVVWW